MFFVATAFFVLALIVKGTNHREISFVGLLYFGLLTVFLALLDQASWQPFILLRYYIYFFGSAIAILIPFFLLLLAFLMLSRIEDDSSLSFWRILFNLFISFTFIAIVLGTAWVIIERNFYMARFLSVYSLVAIYLIVNLLVFWIVNLLLTLFRFSRQDKEGLVILGAKLTADGQLSPILKRRLDKGVQLYHQLKYDDQPFTIYVSGGGNPEYRQSEADLMNDYLLGKGIPSQAIIKEGRALNTRENLMNLRSLMSKRADAPSAEKVIIITSYFHLLRTYLYAWRYGYSLKVVGVSAGWGNGVWALLREFLAFFVLTKELNYLFILGYLFFGIRQVLAIFIW